MQWHRICMIIPKERTGSRMRKHWPKTRSTFSKANYKFRITMCNVKTFFRSPNSFNFVSCNTLPFLGLVPHPVYSFPWQVSHDSEIFNILRNRGFTFTALYNGPSGPSCRDNPDICLPSAAVLNTNGEILQPLSWIPESKATTS